MIKGCLMIPPTHANFFQKCRSFVMAVFYVQIIFLCSAKTFATPHPGDTVSPKDIYRQWWQAFQKESLDTEINEDHSIKLTGWRFFSHGEDNVYRAVVYGGQVLTLRSGTGWRSALQKNAAKDLAQIVVWIEGKATLSPASGPGPDAEIQPPTLRRLENGEMHFQAWMGMPPSFTPHRLVIKAWPDGVAVIHHGSGNPSKPVSGDSDSGL
jgi:hypothetical protein